MFGVGATAPLDVADEAAFVVRHGPCHLISALTAADAARVSSTNARALTDQTMNLRYPGTCRLCGAPLSAGERAVYERASKTVRCVLCAQVALDSAAPETLDPADPPTIETGTAGASAQREDDRRAPRRAERIRSESRIRRSEV